jgi:hypothetical protein
MLRGRRGEGCACGLVDEGSLSMSSSIPSAAEAACFSGAFTAGLESRPFKATAKAKAKNTGVSPLRFAPVERTNVWECKKLYGSGREDEYMGGYKALGIAHPDVGCWLSLPKRPSQTSHLYSQMEDRPVAFRRCLLLTAALLPLAVPQARAQAAGTAAPTQAATSVPQTAPATALAFDVASIRLNNTASDGHHHIYNDPGESHFRTVNLSLKDLLQFAYDLPASQIVGGPSWIDSTLFDIDAKSDHSIDVQLHALSNDQAKLQKRLMVQALIADLPPYRAPRDPPDPCLRTGRRQGRPGVQAFRGGRHHHQHRARQPACRR